MPASPAPSHIVAMGGGGFSMEPNNLLLDTYVLELSGKRRPRVCFVPTASGDAATYVINFFSAFSRLACTPTYLPLLSPTAPDPGSILLEQDVIYVGGGNTKNLLALWREWHLDQTLRAAWSKGIILCGMSAGCICWFEQGLTDSVPGALTVLGCLGFLRGSCCPHYDSWPGRRPKYQGLVAEGRISPGYGLDDGTALHYVGEELAGIVSSRPQARAFRVESTPEGFTETALEPEFLGRTL